MKNYFIAILSLLSFSCTAQNAKDNSQEIIHYLTHAIKSTAYSALVKETSVQFVGQLFDENPDDDLIEEEYRIKAKVLETYRGKVLTELAYTVIVEKGESINIKSHPVILTLCEYEQGFYWPGVGSQFPGNDQYINAARKIKPELNLQQDYFSSC